MSLKLALVGLGVWGQNFVKTCEVNSEVELVAVATRTPIENNPSVDSCEFYTSWKKLLTEVQLDGILLTAPPAINAKVASHALSLGLPVFIEKPFALSAADAELIFQNFDSDKGILQVGYIDRHNSAWQGLKKNLSALGGIEKIDASFGGDGPIRKEISALWDWGSHPLALIIELLGKPDSISATRTLQEEAKHGMIENYDIELSYLEKTAYIKTGNGFKSKQRRVVVTGKAGELIYDDYMENKLVLKTAEGSREVSYKSELSPLANELQFFCDLILDSKKYDDDLKLGQLVTNALLDIENMIRK